MSQNKTSFPFYVYPMSHKRSTQIIKETKAEIKKMESHRPSTPFGRKKSEKEYNMPVSSRPTSSSSLKSLKYEHEEDCYLSVRKLTPFCGVKRKDVNSSNLKLEPLVTKSVLTPRKNINSLMKSQHHKDITFPPISCEEKTKDKVKNAENLIKHEISPHTSDVILADCLSNISCVDSGVLSEENFKTDYTSSLDPEQIEKLNIEDENFDELYQELKHILYVLDKNVKLGSRKCEQDLISAICKLYNLLKDNNAFQIMHSYRIPLLKTLFKLLDPNSPVLCLHIIQLLLQMKVKDKNLGTIFRLTSRLISYKHVKLEQYQIMEPLIEAVQEISFQNKETILYGINVLKSLLFRDMIEHQHLEECAAILLQHLSQFNDLIPSAEERCDDTYIDINKQIFISLHYLADNEDVWKVLSNPSNLCEILKALSYFYQNSDVIQIIVRLISKIIDKEDGCQAFAACPENLLIVLSRILQTHKYNIDITLQTTFIIGNLVLVDKQLAETFLNQFSLHDILTDILEEYAKEHIQTKRTLSEKFITSQSDASDNHDWRQNMFEVISRVLCILANICLSSEAGSFLAHQKDTIMHLLNIISAYLKQDVLKDTSLPVYSFLVVIGNISYYLPAHSDSSLKIAKRIIPLLDDKFSLDVRRESATIVQNLTRFPEVRKYIEDYSLLPAFIKLLSEDDIVFNNAAYGIILNLLLDKNNHSIFYKEQGIARILHKLHLCTERDWKTSSMLCQILWNYCKCLNEDIVPISKIEAQHLIKYLSYSISINETIDVENSNSYFTWKNEFCPVAKKLLTLLQSKISSTT